MEKPLRIMIVEDNALEGLGLSVCVKELGHDVRKIASCAEDAIAFAKENALDCILLDINLNGEDGVETMAEIQKFQDIPFGFITGYSDAQTVDRAARLGPYGYLVKPVDINDIRSTLIVARQIFENKQKLEQEVDESRRQLSERKIIERAKVILMDTFDYSESAAMTVLQKKSQKSNRKIVDVAKEVIKMKNSADL